MHVSIIKQIYHEKGYQIMVADGYGFNHLYPGKLFTLDQAKTICTENNFIIDGIGDIWQCSKNN